MNIDKVLLLFFNDFTGKYFFLDALFYFLAQVLPIFLLLFLGFLLIISWRKNIWIVGGALFAGLFTKYALVELMRKLFPRLRPFHVLDEINLIAEYKESFSFPSGHTAVFFAISTVIYLKNKKMGIAFYSLSFLMGVSRVVVGVHWPLDILLGIFVGILGGLLLGELAQWVERLLTEK